MTDTSDNAVKVSDRALLRFLEHHRDIDVEQVRQQIATSCKRGAQAGAPVVRVGKARFLLRDHEVVGCLRKGARVTYQAMDRLIREAGS